jgi:hypothetical protein
MIKLSRVALSAALLFATFATIPANAAIQIAASDNGGATYYDLSGILGIASNGIIPFTFSDGSGAALSFDTALGQPINATALSLASSDITISGKAGQTILLAVTDTGYTSPTGPAYLTDQLAVTTLTAAGTVGLTGYEDNSNHSFATTSGNPFTTLDSTAKAAAPLSLSGLGSTSGTTGPFNFASPYSLTEIASVTFSQDGCATIGFTAQLGSTAVPEPASILLFGSVLAGAGLVMRKRFLAAK